MDEDGEGEGSVIKFLQFSIQILRITISLTSNMHSMQVSATAIYSISNLSGLLLSQDSGMKDKLILAVRMYSLSPAVAGWMDGG